MNDVLSGDELELSWSGAVSGGEINEQPEVVGGRVGSMLDEIQLETGECTDSEVSGVQVDLIPKVDATDRRPRLSSLRASLMARITIGRRGDETRNVATEEYILYRWRWFMLLSLCLLNVSNGTVRPSLIATVHAKVHSEWICCPVNMCACMNI